MVGLIRTGNIKLVLCFACYLAWWTVAFNPVRPIRGMRSGWLLIPAFVLGVLALVDIMRGLVFMGGPVPSLAIIAGGAVCYVVLLAITRGLMQRPVTTELLIIVLWATVVVLEANSLVALHTISPVLGLVLALLSVVCAAASIVCYLRFYELETTAAFVDGAIPLLLACVMTGAIVLLSATA